MDKEKFKEFEKELMLLVNKYNIDVTIGKTAENISKYMSSSLWVYSVMSSDHGLYEIKEG